MDYAKFIRRRLRNLGVSPDHATKAGRWFLKQVLAQGEEHAITYLKKVGEAILHHFFEEDVSKPEWVATKHRFPKGIIYLRDYPLEVNLRIAKFARACRLRQVNPSQIEKVVGSATTPYQGTVSGTERISKFIRLGVSSSPAIRSLKGKTFPDSPKSLGFEYLGYDIGEASEAIAHDFAYVISQDECIMHPHVGALFPGVKHEIAGALGPDGVGNPDEDYVGEIFACQEGGGKLRMYAAPFIPLQALLRPVHKWIDGFRTLLPTDCTYDQESGAAWAQSILRDGGIIHSVDLSAATCRFPLRPQLDFLVLMGIPQWDLDLLVKVCRGVWSVDPNLQAGGFPPTIQWRVGQPLGIAPSMSMFSTCHNLLLRGIAHAVGADLDCFRVLGDDVVISDSRVHEMYLSVLNEADIPISGNKSFNSTNYAEFAGFSITRQAMVRPGQWREASKSNHLSLCEEFGTPLQYEVPAHWLTIERFHLWLTKPEFNPRHDSVRFLKAASLMRAHFSLPSGIFFPTWEYRVFKTAFPESSVEKRDGWEYLAPLVSKVLDALESMPKDVFNTSLPPTIGKEFACIIDTRHYLLNMLRSFYPEAFIRFLGEILQGCYPRVYGDPVLREALEVARDTLSSVYAGRSSSFWSTANFGIHYTYGRWLQVPA